MTTERLDFEGEYKHLRLYREQILLFLGRYADNIRTEKAYRDCIRRLLNFMNDSGLTSLDEMNLEKFELFKLSLKTANSVKTANMTLICIKSLFEFLQTRGVITVNESRLVKGPQLSSREQKTEFLTYLEVRRMFQEIYTIKDDFQRDSNKIMFLLLINAGLRVDELVNLKLKDITLEKNHMILNVIGKGMRHRIIALSDAVAKELRGCIESLNLPPGSYVVTGNDRVGNVKDNKPLCQTSVMFRVKKIARKAKITKVISTHSLRRTCATLLYRQDVPIEVIQRILGHENVATTHRYIDSEIDAEVSYKHALKEMA